MGSNHRPTTDALIFLTALYVLADDFCNSQNWPRDTAPALAPAEVLTLALLRHS